MELPIVDNEFLSLFLPETSEFNMDDILNDFKFYIFKMMSLGIDSLIQEQINNEYDNNISRKEFKTFFNDRINTVLEVNNLYTTVQNKIAIIKNSLEKGRNIIEENSELFNMDKINLELNILNKYIQCNKSFTNNSTHNVLLDLLNIPCCMIDCFRNKCLDLYLEYYNYIKEVDNTHNDDTHKSTIRLVKTYADKINEILCNLIQKMIRQNSRELNDFKYEEIFDILNLNSYSNKLFKNSIIFKNKSESESYSPEMKIITVILYQFSTYYKTISFNTGKIFTDFFNFCKEKIFLINDVGINDTVLSEFSINYIMEEYFIPTLKNYYFDQNNGYSINLYKERKNELVNFISNSILKNNPHTHIIVQVKEIINSNFFAYLDHILNMNQFMIKRYLSGVKDIKKLLTAENQNQLTDNKYKNELLVILYNNLSEIYNDIIAENITQSNVSIKDKYRILSSMEEHVEKLLTIIQNFFNDNFYLMRQENISSESIDNFKKELIDTDEGKGVVIEFLQDIHSLLGLRKLWLNKTFPEKKLFWDNFLNNQ
jgi:hypothetical protein